MRKIRSFAIADYVKAKKYCSVTELRQHFCVSSATIHRDIAELVMHDVLLKVHGGVAFNTTGGRGENGRTPRFLERIDSNRAAKEIIAQKALSRICEGDIIFLDSSTTVSYLAELLQRADFAKLTIVTNAVTILQQFHKFPPHYVLIGLGGSYDLQLNAFLGQAALRELDRLTIWKAFVSAFGVTDEDVSTNHEYHALLLSHVLEKAEKRFLLADKSKFHKNGLFKVASPRVFDEIISD